MAIPRIRTINECAAYFAAEDPGTYMTGPIIRKLIREGVLPYFKSGTRFLLNLDDVERILSDPELMKPKLTALKPSRPSRMKRID